MRLAAVAGERHAVLSSAEIEEIGLTKRQRLHRARTGRLFELYPSVYAVGHTRLTLQGRWRAAVLACGPHAALSHRDTGKLWGIRQSARRKIDVTTPQRSRVGHPGIDLHRVRHLDPRDVTVRDHIRVTTVARTLVDLTDVLDDRGLRQAVKQSAINRLLDRRELEATIARANGRRNLHRLEALLDEPMPPTRSELEDRFLALCHDARIPLPQVNAPIGPYLADFYWPDFALVVETDGKRVHDNRFAFEDDRTKAADLAASGLHVVPFTWRRVTDRPEEVKRILRSLIRRRARAAPRSPIRRGS